MPRSITIPASWRRSIFSFASLGHPLPKIARFGLLSKKNPTSNAQSSFPWRLTRVWLTKISFSYYFVESAKKSGTDSIKMTYTCNEEGLEILQAKCLLKLHISTFGHCFAIDFQALTQELAVSILATSSIIPRGIRPVPYFYRPPSVHPRPLQAPYLERRTGRKHGSPCNPWHCVPLCDSYGTATSSYQGSLSLNVLPSRRFGKRR